MMSNQEAVVNYLSEQVLTQLFGVLKERKRVLIKTIIRLNRKLKT